MPIIQGQVGQPTQTSATDGQQYAALMGKQLDLIVSELHGKYYTQAVRGNVFWGSTAAAGAAIPASGTAVTNHILWNPAGSGKNAVLVRAMFGWVATTEAPGNIQYAFTTGAGSAVATAAPISAFTALTAQNALLGAGAASVMKFGSAATLLAAGTLLGTLGMSHLTTTGTATFGTFMTLIDFDGMLIVPPGVAVYPYASAATASTYTGTLIWVEVPI